MQGVQLLCKVGDTLTLLVCHGFNTSTTVPSEVSLGVTVNPFGVGIGYRTFWKGSPPSTRS